MRRFALLAVTVAFIIGLGTITVGDVVNHGITPIDVASGLILAFIGVAIIGALTHAPPE